MMHHDGQERDELVEIHDKFVEEVADLVADGLGDEVDGDGDPDDIVLEHLDQLVNLHQTALRFLFELVGRRPADLNLEERVDAWLTDYAVAAPPEPDVALDQLADDEKAAR
jgi:hypothetical protein